MFLQHKGSGKEKRVYICRSYRLKRGDKTSTEIVEKLGTLMDIEAAHPGVDPMEWAKARCAELTRLAKKARKPVKVELDPAARVSTRKQHPVTGGMIPLMRPFFQWMGIGRICKDIKARHRFKFDLEGIMEALCFGRVLCPDSKVATLESSKSFVTGTDASIEDVYLALSVMAKESTFIQKELYRNTKKAGKRNTGIIYYDCTNYYFEIEKDDSDSYDAKEHRSNPIVQCGLLMDAEGMPLAFCINPGNNPVDLLTIIPLEEAPHDFIKTSRFNSEIESLFRIPQTGLSIKPDSLQRKDLIISHFTIGFIALLMVKRLQQELGGECAVDKIIGELRDMRYICREGAGYIAAFSPSPLKDKFNQLTDSCLDAEFIPGKTMRAILKKQR